MDQSAIAVRYGKALYSLAGEKNKVQQLKDDFELISELLKGDDLSFLMTNQGLNLSQKKELLQLSFQDKVDDLTIQFMMMVLDNGRGDCFDDICRYLLSCFRDSENEKFVQLITAVEMSQQLIQKIVGKLEQELHAKIDLHTHIDPSIIGGFVLRIDNQQYDASMQSRLQKAKQMMLDTAF
ncbi:MAG: ATP synthase F1 subunit delta [Mangrovibacterium sp.]